VQDEGLELEEDLVVAGLLGRHQRYKLADLLVGERVVADAEPLAVLFDVGVGGLGEGQEAAGAGRGGEVVGRGVDGVDQLAAVGVDAGLAAGVCVLDVRLLAAHLVEVLGVVDLVWACGGWLHLKERAG